jgi:hypothetical protein
MRIIAHTRNSKKERGEQESQEERRMHREAGRQREDAHTKQKTRERGGCTHTKQKTRERRMHTHETESH